MPILYEPPRLLLPSRRLAPDILWAVDALGARAFSGIETRQGGANFAPARGYSGLAAVLADSTRPFSSWDRFLTSDGAGAGDFTLLALAAPVSESTIRTLVAQRINTSFVQAGLYANMSTAGAASAGNACFFTNNGGASAVQTAAVDGNWRVYAGRRSGTNHSIWVDGVNRSNSALTVRTVGTTGSLTAVGAAYNGTTDWVSEAIGVPFALAAVWNRALADSDLYTLGVYPWLLFGQPRRRIWVPVEAGGPTAITGSSAVAFSVTSALTGTGALVGASAAAFAASGALTGTGRLLGASSATFAASGALTGIGRMAGASAPAFAVTSTLTGTGALLGSSSATFAASATLTGAGALTATVPLAFTSTGALTSVSSGAIAGAVSIAFANSGTLTGTGAMASTVALTASATAALTGLGRLASTVALASSVTGTLTSAASGAITGTSAASFAVSGTLTGQGALQGAAALTFSLAASLSGLTPIAGVVSVAISVNGTLSNGASADLIGSVGLTINLAGALTGTGAMESGVPAAFVVAGILINAEQGPNLGVALHVGRDERTFYVGRDPRTFYVG